MKSYSIYSLEITRFFGKSILKFRVELSQGQAFVFPLSQGIGPVRTDLLIFPHTQLTNMIRIVVVSIDGAFMGGFSDIKVIGCMETNAPLIQVHSVVFII